MGELLDLSWFGRGTLNESLVPRLFVLKVWNDVVLDGLGDAPLSGSEIGADVDIPGRPKADIGLLVQVGGSARVASIRAPAIRIRR